MERRDQVCSLRTRHVEFHRTIPSLFNIPGRSQVCSEPISTSHVVSGTLGGAFILDYLGAKYTMVSVKSRFEDSSFETDLGMEQITGLLLQAVVGFIMSGLYQK